jgi:hypothetical protein
MDYKKTAPNIPARSGSGTSRTSRNNKGNEILFEKQETRKCAIQPESSTFVRLRDLNLERALARCVSITVGEWSVLDDSAIIELWEVFRTYIHTGYEDNGQPVLAAVADVWEHCRKLIDREVQL